MTSVSFSATPPIGPSRSATPSVTGSTAQVATGSHQQLDDDRRSRIIMLLEIPIHLVTPKGERKKRDSSHSSLRLAYARYLAKLDAGAKYEKMLAAGTWPLARVLDMEIIELFMSKTYWYDYSNKLFPKVAEHYPKMVEWLTSGDNEGPSDFEVWGEPGPFTWQDLQEWLKREGPKKSGVGEMGKKKGKGKEKAQAEVDSDHRGQRSEEKEREKEKEKRKHKKKGSVSTLGKKQK